MSEFNLTYAEVKRHILNVCFNKSGNTKKQINNDSFWHSTSKRNKTNAIKERILPYILEATDNDYNMTTRVMLYLSKERYLSCRYCGKKVNKESCYCSNDHARKHGEIIKRKRLQSQYGENIVNVFQLKNIIEKSKKTCFEKYGVENVSYLDKNKKRNAEYRKLHQDELIEKSRQTMLKRYGVTAFSKSDLYNKKVKETCLKKYGVEHHTQSDQWKEKRKLNEPTQKHLNMDVLLNKDLIIELYNQGGIDLIKEKSGCENNCAYVYLRKYGIKVDVGSSYEMFFRGMLNDYGIKYVTNTRKIIKPKELDIFIEDHKLALEVNGTFYHNDEIKSINYHYDKTNQCLEKGIQLLHIFDSDNKDIWKSIIKAKLGLYDVKIGARKCTIKEVSTIDCNEFLKNNHMQGACVSKYNYGLYYKDELISIMTFGKPRFTSKYDWELIRFCSKLNYNVIGAASKLLAYFKNNHSGSIISYANRRWSNGDLYNKLGFKKINITKPNYFYINLGTSTLYTRYQCQKHKLEKLLKNFDASLSEYENMKQNGYYRLWDSGNIVYVKE